MKFKEYYYVKRVADYHNFTKAAKSLYISQPSLSAYISKMEMELGVELFDRTSSPIKLTKEGEVFLETYSKIIDLYNNMKSMFSSGSKEYKKNLVIGIPGSRSIFMIPIIFPQFEKEFPDVKLEIIEDNSMSLLNKVKNDEIDFSIMPFFPDLKDIESTTIYYEELFLVTHKDSFVSKSFIDITELENKPFYLLKKDHGVRRELDRYFKSISFKPNIKMETRNNMMALKMAVANKGFAVVPKMTIDMSYEVEEMAIIRITKKGYFWTIVANKLKDKEFTIVEKRIIEMLQEYFST